jgi:RHS repeat-associated protein
VNGLDDAHRRIVKTVHYGAFDATTVSEYDGLERVVAYTGPTSNRTAFSYNAAGLLDSAAIPGAGAIAMNVYTNGSLAEITLPGGSRIQMEYSAAGLTTNRLLDPVGNLVDEETYFHDREGRVAERSRGPAGATLGYDTAGQIAWVSGFGPAEAYHYDAAGNRTQGPGAGDDFAFNALNQVTNAPGASYLYDINGNLARRVRTGVTNVFTFDEDNRLVAIGDGSGGEIARYAYGAEGHRLMKVVGGVTNYFLYEPFGLVAEFDAAGGVIREYGHLPGNLTGGWPLHLRTPDAVYYYFNDRMGAPLRLVSASGATVWSADRATWGAATVDGTPAISNPLRFSSQYYDEESGLHYNTQRYYDPETGRYISRDPIEEGGGLNTYLFAANDPFNRLDPFGLEWSTVNCHQLQFKLGAGATVIIGFEASANLSGQMCDCCNFNDNKNTYRARDYLKVAINSEVKLKIGLGGKVDLGVLGVDWGFGFVVYNSKSSTGFAKNCGDDYSGVEMFKEEKRSIGLTPYVSVALGLGIAESAGSRLEVAVKRSISRRGYKADFKLSYVQSHKKEYKAGPLTYIREVESQRKLMGYQLYIPF